METQSYPFLDNTRADIRLLGVPNILSPFAQFTSASRVGMLNHHLSQTMVLDKPEFNKIFTGAEAEVGKYSFNNSERKWPCEIVATIPKYHPTTSGFGTGFNIADCPQIYVIVLTIEPNGVRRLDYFEINRYMMGNNGFGFLPNIPIENLRRLRAGEYLDPETVISHSPNMIGDQYANGTNLNICYGSFPETIEDAFVISETAAKKLQTTQVSRITLNCRQDRRPLNLNGNEIEEKFLPDIGSYVRDDGILCAFRPTKWETCLADTAPDALRQPLHLQDDIYTIEPGAKIIDLTFNVNNDKINSCYDQALMYMRNNTRCWEAIYQCYMEYKAQNIPLTKKMSTLVTTAMFRMIAQGKSIPSLEHAVRKEMRNFDIEGVGRQTIDFLQVEVTYTVPRTVHPGDKISDLHGGKGVIGRIYPDDWMPVDEYGIRADMMVDMNSPVGRNNAGQLYETQLNRISEFARMAIKETYETQGSEPAFNKLMDYYGDINPNYERLIREDTTKPDDRKEVVQDAIENGPRLWIPPFLETLTPKEDDNWFALRNMKKWAEKWGCKPSRIKYKIAQADGTGREFVSEAKFSIGSKYIIHLHKIPEITAPGFAAVNHIGIPTKSNFENKYFPVSTNPYRLGEDELRLLVMDTKDAREVTRFQNLMANSPKGVTCAIQQLLLSEHPTRINRIGINNGDLVKSSAPLSLFHNTTVILGVDTKDTITQAFDVSDEISDSIWQIAGEEGNKAVSMLDDDDDVVVRKQTSKKIRAKKMRDNFEAIAESEDVNVDGLEPPSDDDDEESDAIVESSDNDD